MPAPAPAPAPATTPAPAPTRSKSLLRPTAPTAGRPAPSARAAPSQQETRALIAAKLAGLDGGDDHFAFLGVAPGAAEGEVQKAYFALAKQLHPDRLRALSIDDVERDAQRLFAAINVAFDVLSTPAKRREYEQLLRSGGASAAEQDIDELAGRIFGAEEQFQRGLMALRRNHFAEAVEAFTRAVDLNPEEGEHHALLGWATWCAAADKEAVAKEVRKRLQRAISTAPKCVSAYFYRGQIAKQQGAAETAIDCFRKVLELEKDHKEAELELRLLTRRQEKEDLRRPSLIDKLRGKP
jgi:tetratricopeptide (TPR) repeat protein